MGTIFLKPHPTKQHCGQWFFRSKHPAVEWPTPLPFGDDHSEAEVRQYVQGKLGLTITEQMQ